MLCYACMHGRDSLAFVYVYADAKRHSKAVCATFQCAIWKWGKWAKRKNNDTKHTHIHNSQEQPKKAYTRARAALNAVYAVCVPRYV